MEILIAPSFNFLFIAESLHLRWCHTSWDLIIHCLIDPMDFLSIHSVTEDRDHVLHCLLSNNMLPNKRKTENTQ